MRALLIAEKPSLMREIEAVYKKYRNNIPYDITFICQRGHLFTLMMPNEMDKSLTTRGWDTIPFYPDEHGGWKYKIIPDVKKGNFLTSAERYKEIENELKSEEYDCIIHAGDPDQEGQLLVDIVLSQLKSSLPVKRFWTNELTENEIFEALLNLKDNDSDIMLQNLSQAAYGRQHLDYLYGINISTACALKMNGRAAIGRVKTPLLAIVDKREEEIKNFKPSTVYGVKVVYKDGFEGVLFASKTMDENTEENADQEDANNSESGVIWFDTKKEATDFIACLPTTLTTKEFTKKEQKTLPPKLFKLATAQIAAGKMGYNDTVVLQTIQSLYEKKLLSYPRTDCEYLGSHEDFESFLKSAAVVPSLTPFVASITPEDIKRVKGTKKWVNDKALQESGHSALRPTSMPCSDFSSLSKIEQDVYELICRQFVAIFLPPLIQSKTCLIAIDDEGNTFRSNGKTLIDAGYTKIFNQTFSDMIIPEKRCGDVLSVDTYDVAERTSVCPKRFTSTDLIGVCENPAKYLDDESLKALGKRLKLGTPATRSPIIRTLIDKDGYIKEEQKGKTVYLSPTSNGHAIVANLKNCAICRVDMTGLLEEKLELIRTGEMLLADFEADTRRDLETLIEEIKSMNMTALASRYTEVGKCPLCGKTILEGGKGYFCSGYKKDDETSCRFGIPKSFIGGIISTNDCKSLISGGVISKKLKNKEGKTWLQDLAYNVQEQKIDFVEHQDQKTQYKCPCCYSHIIKTQYAYVCEKRDYNDKSTCQFNIPLVFCKKKLPEKEIKELFGKNRRTGVIEGFVSPKSGKKFNAALMIDKEKQGIAFDFPKKEEPTEDVASSYNCFLCGKGMLENNISIHCMCGLSIPKVIAKKKLSDENLQELIGNGSTSGTVYGFYSDKKKKRFNARLVINRTSRKVEFDFS